MTSYTRFHQTTVEFLDFIASCIEDLRESGFDKYTAFSVNAAKNILVNYKPVDLLDSFILHHGYWKHIHGKDERFILEEVPVLYADTKIDVNLVIYPYKVFSSGKKSPIEKEDIDNMWAYFDSMVCIACNHIYNKRLSDADYWSKVNIEDYAKLFGIPLKKD